METPKIACFEITSEEIKLLIGFCLADKPYVLYCGKRPLPKGLIEKGIIQDEDRLKGELASFARFQLPEQKLIVNLHEICLILPPLGLKIYQTKKMTVMSNVDKKISKIDLANVIQMAKNESLPQGEEVVDIIPASYELSDKSVYVNPPLEVSSDFMYANLFIHALPRTISSDYLRLANLSDCHVKKAAVAPYCEALLFASDESLPKTYLLIDIGERYSALTLIGDGQAYRSQSIFEGGSELSEHISKQLGIPFDEAESLKRTFGYVEKRGGYEPSLGKGTKEGSLLEESFTQKDLNASIEDYFSSFFKKVSGAIGALSSESQNDLTQIPIVLTGGGSKLNGLSRFFASYLPSHELHFPSLSYLGADQREFAAPLGMVIAASHYTGSMEDNQRGVATVTRTSGKEKKAERRNLASEDTL